MNGNEEAIEISVSCCIIEKENTQVGTQVDVQVNAQVYGGIFHGRL